MHIGFAMYARIARYFHTLRFLTLRQLLGRLIFRYFRPSLDLGAQPPTRPRCETWTVSARKKAVMTAPDRCRLLNDDQGISSPAIWNDPTLDRLWLYNLHYFDDLNAEDSFLRTEWHQALIEHWVLENPPGEGVGWEPYPTSLRIVNWIKWALAGNRLESG